MGSLKTAKLRYYTIETKLIVLKDYCEKFNSNQSLTARNHRSVIGKWANLNCQAKLRAQSSSPKVRKVNTVNKSFYLQIEATSFLSCY